MIQLGNLEGGWTVANNKADKQTGSRNEEESGVFPESLQQDVRQAWLELRQEVQRDQAEQGIHVDEDDISI